MLNQLGNLAEYNQNQGLQAGTPTKPYEFQETVEIVRYRGPATDQALLQAEFDGPKLVAAFLNHVPMNPKAYEKLLEIISEQKKKF